MSISVGGKIVTDGLIIHYDALNGKSYPGSGTTWNDLTPYANNGNLNIADNPVTIANGYASFKADSIGSDNRYMLVADPLPISTTDYLTVDIWANIPSNFGNNLTANPYLFGFNTYGICFRELSEGTTNGEFGFISNFNDIFGINDLTFITSSMFDKWVHYSFVMCNELIPSSSQKIYVNSTPLTLSQVRGNDSPGGRSFTNDDIAFGTRINAANQRATTYDAAIIKVYNRELTQAEITQNFNAHKGRFNIY